ncbi:hypothetical protein BGZ68_008775 [Mortierella alpina]|nr:hypothetical protein BGZ68_008775 [Mortierella alpina]
MEVNPPKMTSDEVEANTREVPYMMKVVLKRFCKPYYNELDSHMLDALQSQARTLERIELRMKHGSTLNTPMLALLLEKTTALKRLTVDEANFGV